MNYRGRFAPSPTGPLHAGSMVAALASWLDARANRGQWLVRIEDVDAPRCIAGVDRLILGQLAACSLLADEVVPQQSLRGDVYAAALQRLIDKDAVFRCSCSRKQIAEHWEHVGRARARNEEWPYPGTCRERPVADTCLICSIRLRCGTDESPIVIEWVDRRLGAQREDITHSCGDFVVRRSDGLWAYQLAVVVDDAAQAISDVVRGADLADNTARQIHLQNLLGLPQPRYLHTPLVLGDDGEKLSKQNGAKAIDTRQPLQVLNAAGQILGIRSDASTPGDWLAEASRQWSVNFPLPTTPGANDQNRPPSAAHKAASMGA
ncbi:MAG: tRNA glutamyl-Q(34) synthetase GluQRS [Ideonella sp.]